MMGGRLNNVEFTEVGLVSLHVCVVPSCVFVCYSAHGVTLCSPSPNHAPPLSQILVCPYFWSFSKPSDPPTLSSWNKMCPRETAPIRLSLCGTMPRRLVGGASNAAHHCLQD